MFFVKVSLKCILLCLCLGDQHQIGRPNRNQSEEKARWYFMLLISSYFALFLEACVFITVSSPDNIVHSTYSSVQCTQQSVSDIRSRDCMWSLRSLFASLLFQ